MTTDEKVPGMGASAAELLDYMGLDAEKWTKMFLRSADLANAGPDFVGTMLSWFANALEAGRVAQYKRTMPHLAIEANRTAHEKGWWNSGRAFDGVIALIHSEASEALEEWRNNRSESDRYYTVAKYRPDWTALGEHLHEWAEALDHKGDGHVVERFMLPDEVASELVLVGFLKPEGIPSELADIIIRVFDAAVEYGIDIEEEVILKMAYNATRAHKHGGKRS